MEYVPVNKQNRQSVNNFISKHWFSTDMVVRGTKIDMTQAEGIAAVNDNDIKGLITYIINGETCEIMSLNSTEEGGGIGTALVSKVIGIAKKKKCGRIIAVTTNDNIKAIDFYQKRGFDLARLYRNALDISRRIKPEIPLAGDNGIPLKHEIEFEMILEK